MQELSLNILDIAQNCISAGASLVEIDIEVFGQRQEMLGITVRDDGAGMDRRTLQRVESPFFTSRTTRKVGMGIPLFKQAAQMSGGSFSIDSRPGNGTVVKAVFDTSNIDCAPLGEVWDTVGILIQMNPDVDFVYRVKNGREVFECDTRYLKQVMEGRGLGDIAVIQWIKEYIEENQFEILKRRY